VTKVGHQHAADDTQGPAAVLELIIRHRCGNEVALGVICTLAWTDLSAVQLVFECGVFLAQAAAIRTWFRRQRDLDLICHFPLPLRPNDRRLTFLKYGMSRSERRGDNFGLSLTVPVGDVVGVTTSYSSASFPCHMYGIGVSGIE
jgi:hypothetical protein